MNNFGVQEVASARTAIGPGWAYVPDTGPNPATTSVQPSNRKRARTQTSVSYADLNARQEAKLRKELENLDRDNQRDLNIPIPPKSKTSSASRAQNKHTPNVRKILQSQKTFSNYMDDFVALSEPNSSTVATSSSATTSSKRPAQKRPDANPRLTQRRHSSKQEEDTLMPDAPDDNAESHDNPLLPVAKPPIMTHPMDHDPLLISRVPAMPSEEELEALVSTPPLNYIEARASWTEDDKQYPQRMFCEVCGFWGRVKCTKCGTRVCALECLETHREECITRYGH